MKLWDNDLCPCCQQVSESTTMHLYLCPHTTVAKARERSFHKMFTCLETVYTDPLMLEIITAFWHSDNLVLDSECPKALNYMYTTLRETSLHQMWLDLLPLGMVEYQASYYQQICSR